MQRAIAILLSIGSLVFQSNAALSQALHPASPQITGQIELQVNYCRGIAGSVAHIPGISQQVILGPSGKGVFYFVVPGTYTLGILIRDRQPYLIENVVVKDNTITQLAEDICQDVDGDGYLEDVDCNDNNDTINPGATEVCGDGIDNNCDGETDEGCEVICNDDDHDAFFAQDGCGTQADCNDSDATINPEAKEICDGVDNNCNNLIDEGTDISSDPNNCGGCGLVCSTPNASAVCLGGSCKVGSCSSGYADCNSDPSDGCEVNVTNDTNHCGACGQGCSTGTSCVSGSCEMISCPDGTADCNGDIPGSCATPLNTLTDCGACGDLCDPIHTATPACVSGSCEVLACDAGYADCDSLAANGCEVNVANDAYNCGTCGQVCSTPNASAVCLGGSCEVSTCSTGYADCDASAANGCETNVKTDPKNCGGCGNSCSSGICTNGLCQ